MGRIQFGNSVIDSINYGGTNIACVFYGSQLIWPSSYTTEIVSTEIVISDGDTGIKADVSNYAVVNGRIRMKSGSVIIREFTTALNLTVDDDNYIVNNNKLYFNYDVYKGTMLPGSYAQVTASYNGVSVPKSIFFKGNYRTCTNSIITIKRLGTQIEDGDYFYVASVGGHFGIDASATRTWHYDSGYNNTVTGAIPYMELGVSSTQSWAYPDEWNPKFILDASNVDGERTTDLAIWDERYDAARIECTLNQYCGAQYGMNLVLDSDEIKEESVIYTSDMSLTIEDLGNNNHEYTYDCDDPNIALSFYDNYIDIDGISSSTGCVIHIEETGSGDEIRFVLYGQ